MQTNPTHSGNPINGDQQQIKLRHSKFPLNFENFSTSRFGEISVDFVAETTASDRFRDRALRAFRTLSFKSPLLSDIQVKHDTYNIPMPAILPFNWEKIYVNPNIGDDVPFDANTVIHEFSKKLVDFFGYLKVEADNYYQTYISSPDDDSAGAYLAYVLMILCSMEQFYSSGSLMSTLGMRYEVLFKYRSQSNGVLSFDRAFDLLLSSFSQYVKEFTVVDSNGGSINYLMDFDRDYSLSLHHFLSQIRDCGYVNYSPGSAVFTSAADRGSLVTLFNHFLGNISQDYIFNEKPFNFSRLIAYQLVCAHYYTNDRVDYVYSADLYRENFWSLFYSFYMSNPDFSYNGINCRYDVFSGHILNIILVSDPTSDTILMELLPLIFGYRNSLRFIDYFTGSKTQPLAVGSTDVNVNNNTVSVIDISQKIQVQRYLNAVNRTGRKVSDYIKGIFGADVKPDYHYPLYLSHVSDSFHNLEVENTASNQLTDANSVTSRNVNNSNRFQFDMSFDIPSILLCVRYYDIPRAYCRATERPVFHENRFDMFNPFLEYIGDQPIYTQEVSAYGSNFAGNQVFGYTTRYMEYKQRFNQASGGFVESLPSWAFLADDVLHRVAVSDHLSPSFIRSQNVELDPYFVNLTGFSLGTYFHFIHKSTHVVEAYRPMSYNPQILY